MCTAQAIILARQKSTLHKSKFIRSNLYIKVTHRKWTPKITDKNCSFNILWKTNYLLHWFLGHTLPKSEIPEHASEVVRRTLNKHITWSVTPHELRSLQCWLTLLKVRLIGLAKIAFTLPDLCWTWVDKTRDTGSRSALERYIIIKIHVGLITWSCKNHNHRASFRDSLDTTTTIGG